MLDVIKKKRRTRRSSGSTLLLKKWPRHPVSRRDIRNNLQNFESLYDPPISMSRVLPFLYLGNQYDATNLKGLQKRNITYVLNVTPDLTNHFTSNNINYMRIPIDDALLVPIKKFFQPACEFIEQARRRECSVLVHCHQGISRSSTIVIAYLMQFAALSLVEAFNFVKIRRPIIMPNPSFIGQLQHFEQELIRGAVNRPQTIMVKPKKELLTIT